MLSFTLYIVYRIKIGLNKSINKGYIIGPFESVGNKFICNLNGMTTIPCYAYLLTLLYLYFIFDIIAT